MTRMIRKVIVTVDIEYDAEDVNAYMLDMAIPHAFDQFTENSDSVTLSWIEDKTVSECAIDEETGDCSCTH